MVDRRHDAKTLPRSQPPLTDRPVRDTRVYFWHYDFHHKVATENMVFLLGAFNPVYRGQQTIQQIETVFRDLGILSFAIWELLGDFDLMLQIWLPRHVTVVMVEEAIFASCRDKFRLVEMQVDDFSSHWMWNKGIDATKSGSDVNPDHYIRLNDPRQKVSARDLERYVERNYIKQTPPGNTYKFFLRISSPPNGISSDEAARFAQGCADAMDRCGILHQSVMRVVGSGGSFLISGRVNRTDLWRLSELSDVINETGQLASRQMRTTTHLSARSGPVVRREQLLRDLVDDNAVLTPTREQVLGWLVQAESDELEFKASAFTDVDFASGKKIAGRRTQDEQAREIARAVCGLLNSEGGAVILGVAELANYTREQIQKYCGQFREYGQVAIVGIDCEYESAGKNWDGYRLKLLRKLRTFIDGGIDGWVKIHRVTLPEFKCDVGVIKIMRPPEFYFVKEPGKDGRPALQRFYGRADGETLWLQGREMEQFRKAHMRTSTG
jgi:hypothetical protein